MSLTMTGGVAVFPTTSTCVTALGPNASCTLTASFAPTLAQLENAAITVTDGNASVTVSLTGRGTP